MPRNLLLIIKREYTTRVHRRAFIISTILLPLLFIGLMALPTVLVGLSGPKNMRVAVVDHTAHLSKAFLGNETMTFEVTDEDLAALRQRDDIDGILVLPSDIVSNPDGATFYTKSSSTMQSEMYISQLLSKAIEQERLASYDIEGLDRIIQDIQANVTLNTFRIDGESEKASSSLGAYILGMLLTLVLYMFIMLYGQMVMTSIIEEKNNRVLEIVVSSVKPTHLMLGKILGIGAVAVTQLAIWAVVIGAFSTFVMPSLVTNALTAGADVDLVQLLTSLGDTSYIMGLFGMMILFLLLGYLFYSSIYAAIGSAVDNVQDASQLQMFALMPIILGMVFSMTILNDPDSTLAVVLSLIPFTSPEVMMARLPFEVPLWQTALSLAILLASTVFMIWFAAKVYRVGIFMYGKKPNIRELIRWARYK